MRLHSLHRRVTEAFISFSSVVPDDDRPAPFLYRNDRLKVRALIGPCVFDRLCDEGHPCRAWERPLAHRAKDAFQMGRRTI